MSQTAYAGGYDTGAANALVPATGGNALGMHPPAIAWGFANVFER